MSFSDLGLAPELLRAVSEKAYTEPTPIQARAIPAVLEGRDVLAGAQTGTGKTAAFVLPILQKLAGLGADTTPIGGVNPDRRAPRALVLTPTRELAAQIAESAVSYGKYAPVRVQVVFGGVNINPQISGLRNGCDLLIATPGRLLDLAQQGAVNLRNVQVLVLDEADRMLDMGFIRDIRRVIKLLPDRRQNLLFSATYSEDMRQLAGTLLRNPVAVEVAARNATADKVDQSVYKVPKDHKRHLLAHLIKEGNWLQVLVFTRTKHGANRLTQQLEGAGIRAAAIHGNKSQGARTRALADFKDSRITVLVATEVAARGLDIKELPHVVNYELPNVPEDYVHRIGRTARAGATGQAVSLVSPDESPLLRDIERLLKRPLQVAAVPDFPISTTPTPPVERYVDPRRTAQAARPSRPQGQRRDGGGRSSGRGGSAPRHGGGAGRSGQSGGQGHDNAQGNRSGAAGGQGRDRVGGGVAASGQSASSDGGFRRQRMH